MKQRRYQNENMNEPDNMPYPRVTWPNDIMPDENALSEMPRAAIKAEVKTDGSNPR